MGSGQARRKTGILNDGVGSPSGESLSPGRCLGGRSRGVAAPEQVVLVVDRGDKAVYDGGAARAFTAVLDGVPPTKRLCVPCFKTGRQPELRWRWWHSDPWPQVELEWRLSLALQHGSETDVAGVREGEHAPHEALLGPRGLLEGEDPLHPSPTLPKEPDNLGEGAVHAGEGPPLDGTDAVAHQALEYSDNVFVAKGVVDVVPAVPADASLGSGAHASLGCVAHASL